METSELLKEIFLPFFALAISYFLFAVSMDYIAIVFLVFGCLGLVHNIWKVICGIIDILFG